MKVRPSVKKMCDKCKIIKEMDINKSLYHENQSIEIIKYLIWYLYLLWSGWKHNKYFIYFLMLFKDCIMERFITYHNVIIYETNLYDAFHL